MLALQYYFLNQSLLTPILKKSVKKRNSNSNITEKKLAAKKQNEEIYDADSLQKLDPIDHIRKRIGMYLGDNTGEGGLSTALREILDNSQDEFLNGYGDKIVVTFFEDGSVEVQDSGRGIPTGINKATGENGIVLSLAHVGAGGKFGSEDGGYKSASAGMNGVGTTASNAISRGFFVTVFQNGKENRMSFAKGKPGRFKEWLNPDSDFTENRDLVILNDERSESEKKARPTGTTIRMFPDFDIFVPGAAFDVETIKFRLKSTAFLLPGLTIEVNDLRDPANPVHDVYDFDGGIAEMLDTITTDPKLHPPVHLRTEGTFTESASVVDKEGNLSMADVERAIDIDIAFYYTNGYDTNVRSFVNVLNTKHGGTHETGFYRAMSKVLIDGIKNTRGMLKAKEEPPTLDDVKEGLTAIISVKLFEPIFSSQDKNTLASTQVTAVLANAFGAQLKTFLNEKKNAALAKLIYTKIVNASRARQASRTQRDAARRKTALESASMPAKLVDCRAIGVDRSELFLVEGDSALGSARQGRNSEYQALLPLRGKILNVQKASLADMLKNAECAAIIQCVGAGSGRTFDIEQMRYGRIMLMADADVDGSHIRTLLIVLFAKYMRPVIESGRLYAAMPPLHKIEVMGKGGETYYTYTQAEMEAKVAEIEKTGKKVKSPVQRYKGLGEMSSELLWESTMNPATRSVRKITMEDAQAAEEMLELLMGDQVAPRRDYIIENADKVDKDAIDA